MNCFLLAGVCAFATCAAFSQSATVQTSVNRNANHVGAMSFTYDAQHDQIVPSGVQLKAHSSNISITPTTGKIVVTVNIDAVSQFGKDTRFHCSLLVIGGEIDTANALVDGAIETANSGAKNGVCTLTIPYSWLLPPDPGAASGMIIAVGVAAVTEGGGVRRSTLQVGGVDSIPGNGATTSLSFDAVL
jgi:hypothetical protein